ncbi:hypothetical protein H0H93_008908 [Arthromyces matolae]|nr:hypothetical protein H0H93_008908 [Arthromyces matolae]
MRSILSLLALSAATFSPVFAAKAGSFADGGNTLVSAMMMFLGNEEKVYILDKAEGNAATVGGHPAWGSVWDIASHQATVMDVKTNTFCSSGMHLPNGSYATFGGNGAIGRGGAIGSQVSSTGNGAWDALYQDFDGSRAIRILNPCTDSDNWSSSKCQWFDDSSLLAMQKQRWYSTAEALADGSIVLIGGFVNGGYINRNYPNTDPQFEGGAAENTYEFYPANGRGVTPLNFLIKTSGLNAYAHAFLLNSGNMLVQANFSTMIWDYNKNVETALPDMPGKVVRVYPASGAVAMLPLTPANNWNPTVLFCGGSDMPEQDWGNYANPAINTWDYPASQDCQRLTPEPLDGSTPAYEQDDDMLEGRTMGQFITLPDGTMLVVNGGLNGTAGYATQTGQTASYSEMPFGMSLASGPVGTPAIYNPNLPKGQRWSRPNFDTSNIARLYHSSAMLLPDGSVLIAGSNPNVDVNTSTIFQTEYRAEIFYPSYFSASTRPVPTGIPSNISYGGPYFDISIPSTSYTGSANAAAGNTTVVLLRGGFTTHAMNMGQRYVQLNNTFTVNNDGSITLHVAQAPNPYILQPGPALLFVTINGIPSNGTMVIVGSGSMGTQPVSLASELPDSVTLSNISGSGDNTSSAQANSDQNTNDNGASGLHTGAIVGGVVGAIAVIGLLGALLGLLLARRRSRSAISSTSFAMTGVTGLGAAAALATGGNRGYRSSDSSAFVPLQHDNHSDAWNGSTVNLALGSPYKDDVRMASMDSGWDPYAANPPSPRMVSPDRSIASAVWMCLCFIKNGGHGLHFEAQPLLKLVSPGTELPSISPLANSSGGGVGGLTFAVAMAQHPDVQIEIFEAAAEFSPVGAGIGLWPRAWKALVALGIQGLDQVSSSKPSDDTVCTLEFRKSDQQEPYVFGRMMTKGKFVLSRNLQLALLKRLNLTLGTLLFFHRADFQAVLIKHLHPSCRVRYGKRLETYKRMKPSDEIELVFEDGSKATCDLLVGWESTGWVANIAYPVSNGRLVNLVANNIDSKRTDTLFNGPWIEDVDTRTLKDTFSDWEPEFRELVKGIDQVSRWAVHTVKPLKSFVSDKVVLLGDAAHAMAAHQGSGAGQAIEDSCVLAALLGHKLANRGSLSEVLHIYDTLRRPFALDIAQRSFDNGKYLSLTHPDFPAGDGMNEERLRELGEVITEKWTWAWETSLDQTIREAIELLETTLSREIGQSNL